MYRTFQTAWHFCGVTSTLLGVHTSCQRAGFFPGTATSPSSRWYIPNRGCAVSLVSGTLVPPAWAGSLVSGTLVSGTLEPPAAGPEDALSCAGGGGTVSTRTGSMKFEGLSKSAVEPSVECRLCGGKPLARAFVGVNAGFVGVKWGAAAVLCVDWNSSGSLQTGRAHS